MFFSSKDKVPMTASELSNITRGLYQAAAATHSLIGQQYIKLFDQFFDKESSGASNAIKAKMVDIALDENHSIEIPLISLVAPRGLALESMNVNLSVRMHGTEVEKINHELSNHELHSEKFYVTFGVDKRNSDGRDPDEVQISMEFKACEPPEAINRLIEEYTNLIHPLKKK